MANPAKPAGDIFLPSGRLQTEFLSKPALHALEKSLFFAGETRWDSIRSPHLFMGLLSEPDKGIAIWGERLGADLDKLLDQFQELFHQEEGDPQPCLHLSREFLSDNVIRLLRQALCRAKENNRRQITTMDLLICLLTAPYSIVAECFERIGVTAAKLTELAVIAEQSSR